MKNLIRIGTVSTLLALALFARPAHAATDIHSALLREGDLISAHQSAGDPDIFIINANGYMRLFLNPAIFSFYGHLGGFANVHQVTAATRDGFTISGLFRNCETNDQTVWGVEVTGEDVGVLHHVAVSGDQAVAQDPHFFQKVFCINTREENSYSKSTTPYYRIADIPSYFRRACTVRPACLDSVPRCLIPEPVEGWCPSSTPTPTPTVTPTITSVSMYSTRTNPSDWWIRIVGTLPDSCTHVTNPSFSRSGNAFLVTFLAQTTGDVCAQVIQNFTQTIQLSDTSLPAGMYTVYVNDRQWTSFEVASPTPVPLY